MNPRPTRELIIVTVFLAGSYPPVLWAAVLALTFQSFAVLVPLAALGGMTTTLIGLWRPMSAGWLGAAAIFLCGWMISFAMLGASLVDGWKDRNTALDAAALAYFTLALVTLLTMKFRWSVWAEKR